MYTTLLPLISLPLLAISSPLSFHWRRAAPAPAPGAGFNLYMTSPECTTGAPTVAAPVSSSSPFCYNLDAHAQAGSFVWPASDNTYQAIFFIAPDCPASSHEKQAGEYTYTYTAKTDVGNGTQVECMGPIWEQPGAGSIWMSPPGVPPPGGWPAPITSQ